MYSDYTQARNKSWEILIKSGISQLPVNLKTISKHLNVSVIPYSKLGDDIFSDKITAGDGFTAALLDGKKLVFINDAKDRKRMRFTLAHELGHVTLNHKLDPIAHRNSESDDKLSIPEVQANVFARDLLMPACVLAKLHMTTVGEIMQICNVSFTSAQIRLNRLLELYKRNMFGVHPLERQVIAQFDQFIKNNK